MFHTLYLVSCVLHPIPYSPPVSYVFDSGSVSYILGLPWILYPHVPYPVSCILCPVPVPYGPLVACVFNSIPGVLYSSISEVSLLG